MRWLIYGSKGWIGQQLVAIVKRLGDGHQVLEAKSRADQYAATYEEIRSLKPDRVISCLGRTSGPGCSNIDYLEQKGRLVENMRDNLHAPVNLAAICQELEIHFTYLGTGCIYHFTDNQKIFDETDKPNFTGSQYSTVKGVTDQIIRQYKTTLNARIRMPITNEDNPRNFITKITSYSRVISIANSMSVLTELLPIMIDMAVKQVTGTVNLTNPGTITHAEILDMYQQLVDPDFKYQVIPASELATVAQRSNNQLSTTKLEKMYPSVMNIRDAVYQTLKSWQPMVAKRSE